MSDNFPIKELVIHCTDSGDTKDFGAADIDKWHKARGWSEIGYAFVVRRDGTIEKGRDVSKIGAHVYGYNRFRIGIVWVGSNDITPAQYLTLVHLIACLCTKYKLYEDNVKGHNEFPSQSKTCPNLDMDMLRRDVAWRLKEKAGVHETCELVKGVCACKR